MESSVAALILLSFVAVAWKLYRFFTRHPTAWRLRKLQSLDWEEFETLCARYFRRRGWRVQVRQKSGADGGVDLRLHRLGKRAIVQCKRYKDAKVGVAVVREMYGLMHEYDAHKVFIVTSSDFTKACYAFASDKPIVLIEGKRLTALMR